MKRTLPFFLLIWLLGACSPATETAVSPQPILETAVLPTNTAVSPPEISTSPTAVPTATQPPADPTAIPAEAVEPTAVAVSAAGGVISGRTEEGAFFLGDPNAPITHIDYSDFL